MAAVGRAKGLRFEEPPGFWGRLVNSVTGWIADHADFLKGIAGVLRQISSIAGLLAMIPVLAPIMGPIAMASAGGAVAIDVTVKAATGEGLWTDIAMDGASFLPVGKGLQALRGVASGGRDAKAVTALTADLSIERLRPEKRQHRQRGARG